MKSNFLIAIALISWATGAWIDSTKHHQAPPAVDFKLVKIADGVFAAIAIPGGVASGNAGFVIGDAGVLIVDTLLTPLALNQLLNEIKHQTNQPVRYAVNTHYHLDHTGGNQVLAAAGVPIVAHENAMQWQTTKNRRFLPSPEELQKRRADVAKQISDLPKAEEEKRTQLQRQLRRLEALSEVELTNPSITFRSGSLHLYLGKREVELSTLPGHTGGDVLVYVPDANVVFAGDLVWSRTLPNLVDATVNDWIPSLETILQRYASARFVPGHGEVAGPTEIREFRDYLNDLRQAVKETIDNGLTLEQTRQKLKLPEKYKSFGFQNFAQPNVEDMYKELKGTKKIN